jgi:monoamine oxidase
MNAQGSDACSPVPEALHPPAQVVVVGAGLPGLVPLPAPGRERIHLAGSEFAPDFPGYLEGAVLAAERAVDALQAQRRSVNQRCSPGQTTVPGLG